MRIQLNVRVPQTTIDQINVLVGQGYESQAHVVIIAINNLYRDELRTKNWRNGMNIKIRETGEIKRLNIIDPRTGMSWVQDLIGNAGALVDGQFVWSADDDAYLASQETYDWWEKYIEDYEATEREIEELAERLGIDANDIRLRVQKNTGLDYEMHRSEARRVLEEIEQEYREQ